MLTQDAHLVLQDNAQIWKQLLPLTYTKPISELRIGIDTIKEKWQHHFGKEASVETERYLMPKFGKTTASSEQPKLIINSSIIPNEELLKEIKALTEQQSLERDGEFIAQYVVNDNLPKEAVECETNFIKIERPWHIFKQNEEVFIDDFKRITAGRKSQPISKTNTLIGEQNIFLEEGASVECSMLNATKAPIYIGKNAIILEGCLVKGGLALCDNAIMKMGAKHYGTSTIGPYCKIGGEVNNVVMQAYSNKGHDGYLGNAVIGEWCNMGADTNASNLKNNYGSSTAYSYAEGNYIDTGECFIGLTMGDHSKCAINTMFNTATVVGVAANIFGGGFPKKHIPSFAWGGVDYLHTFQLEKAFEMAQAMMKRRNLAFTEEDKAIFNTIFEETKQFRNT